MTCENNFIIYFFQTATNYLLFLTTSSFPITLFSNRLNLLVRDTN